MRLRLVRALIIAASMACALAVATAAHAAPLIVIDPGHGGIYSNANANGLHEKDVNLQIALELRKELVARGYETTMTRTTDRAVSMLELPTWNWSSASNLWSYARDWRRGDPPKDDLQARVNLANAKAGDLFICIHCNGSSSKYTRGVETYASPRDARGKSVSSRVQKAIVANTHLYDRGAKTEDYYVLRWANMPAILVEAAFISSPADAYLLKQRWFRREVAIGIAQGTDSWFKAGGAKPVAHALCTSTTVDACVALSKQVPSTSTRVVIAREDQYAALAPLPSYALQTGARILWAGDDSLATTVTAELEHLAPSRVDYVGLDSTLNSSLKAEIHAAAPKATLSVITKPDAAALSVELARRMTSQTSGVVYVADSTDRDRAIPAAAGAAAQRVPLLLGTFGVLSAEAKTYLQENRSWIRSVRVVSSSLSGARALGSGVASMTPIVGTSFEGAAAAINDAYYKSKTRAAYKAVVADKRQTPAYLTAIWYAAYAHQPLIPVSAKTLPATSRWYLVNHRVQLGAFEAFDAKRTLSPQLAPMLQKADAE